MPEGRSSVKRASPRTLQVSRFESFPSVFSVAPFYSIDSVAMFFALITLALHPSYPGPAPTTAIRGW